MATSPSLDTTRCLPNSSALLARHLPSYPSTSVAVWESATSVQASFRDTMAKVNATCEQQVASFAQTSKTKVLKLPSMKAVIKVYPVVIIIWLLAMF